MTELAKAPGAHLSRGFYFDRQGKPISRKEWCQHLESREYCFVKQDQIGEILVSTVWLGLDHSFGGDKPILFETMVFGPEGTPEKTDLACWRYSTEQEALEGHARAIAVAQPKVLGDGQTSEGHR